MWVKIGKSTWIYWNQREPFILSTFFHKIRASSFDGQTLHSLDSEVRRTSAIALGRHGEARATSWYVWYVDICRYVGQVANGTRVASCCQVASPHAASLCTRMLANRPGVKSQEISVVKSEWQALGDGTVKRDLHCMYIPAVVQLLPACDPAGALRFENIFAFDRLHSARCHVFLIVVCWL